MGPTSNGLGLERFFRISPMEDFASHIGYTGTQEEINDARDSVIIRFQDGSKTVRIEDIVASCNLTAVPIGSCSIFDGTVIFFSTGNLIDTGKSRPIIDELLTGSTYLASQWSINEEDVLRLRKLRSKEQLFPAIIFRNYEFVKLADRIWNYEDWTPLVQVGPHNLSPQSTSLENTRKRILPNGFTLDNIYFSAHEETTVAMKNYGFNNLKMGVIYSVSINPADNDRISFSISSRYKLYALENYYEISASYDAKKELTEMHANIDIGKSEINPCLVAQFNEKGSCRYQIFDHSLNCLPLLQSCNKIKKISYPETLYQIIKSIKTNNPYGLINPFKFQ